MASQDWFEKDFYKTLGVEKDISDADLRKAYRKLARKYHPDSNQGNKTAEEKFKEISEAYDVLSDADKRKEYDQIRAMGAGARFSAGSGGPGGAGNFEDLFGNLFGQGGYAQPGTRSYSTSSGGFEDLFGGMFGGGAGGPAGFQAGPRKGNDQRASTTLNFMTAIKGDTIDLQAGDGRVITVRIPAGVKDGQKIRLRGKGSPGPQGGEPGDLILEVAVRPHPVFRRDGNNIEVTVPITFVEAVRGATIEVPTIEGKTVKVRVPEFSQTGKKLRVKGRGVKTKSATGDMVVELAIIVPNRLTSDQEKALDAFIAATPADNPRDDLLREALV